MKLYMHPASITSRIVRLYAAEKGIELDEEVVDLFSGAHHQEPFVSVNPNRLVPVLEDGDFRLTESAAILIYLAEKLDLPEYPKNLQARARVTRSCTGRASTSTATGATISLPAAIPAPQAADRGGPPRRRRVGARQERFLAAGARRPLVRRRTDLDHRRHDHGCRLLRWRAVALGDIIRWDFGRTPGVAAWLAQVKALPRWDEVSEALDGFAASVKEQSFVA